MLKKFKASVVCCCTLNNKTILWWTFIRQVSTNTGNYQLPLFHCNTLHWRRFLAPGLVCQVFCDVMSNSLLTTKVKLNVRIWITDTWITDSTKLQAIYCRAFCGVIPFHTFHPCSRHPWSEGILAIKVCFNPSPSQIKNLKSITHCVFTECQFVYAILDLLHLWGTESFLNLWAHKKIKTLPQTAPLTLARLIFMPHQPHPPPPGPNWVT